MIVARARRLVEISSRLVTKVPTGLAATVVVARYRAPLWRPSTVKWWGARWVVRAMNASTT